MEFRNSFRCLADLMADVRGLGMPLFRWQVRSACYLLRRVKQMFCEAKIGSALVLFYLERTYKRSGPDNF